MQLRDILSDEDFNKLQKMCPRKKPTNKKYNSPRTVKKTSETDTKEVTENKEATKTKEQTIKKNTNNAANVTTKESSDTKKDLADKTDKPVRHTKRTDSARQNKDFSKPYIKNTKKHITECPYCGGKELTTKPNGYIYCENCGINVEKG